jgi:hypothetical protein
MALNLLTRDDLKSWMAEHRSGAISIFMPTFRKGRETEQNPIRLKNLLREAEARLLDRGVSSLEAQSLLEPAQALVLDTLFWQYQQDGLALFIAVGLFRYYRFPLDFSEFVAVGNRFYIKPLLPLLSGDGQFFVLALSKNEVRLLKGTRNSVDQVDLEDVPQSLARYLRFDDPEKQLQFHTGTTQRRGQRAAIFHGHGVGTNEAQHKVNLLRYFHEVDAGVQELLRSENRPVAQAPLVLAGVEYLLPLYREANTYPSLLEEGIEGNPEEFSPEELHQRAWSLVRPYFQRAQEEASAAYSRLAGSEQASDEIREIVVAAHQGRVDTLFVALGLQQWGSFEPRSSRVLLHEKQETADGDLLDLAALATLLNGGTVYAVEPTRVPGGGLMAAIFRY